MNRDFLMSVYNNAAMATLDDIRNMAEDLMDAQEKLDAKPAKFEVKMDDQGNVIIPLSDYLREVAPEVKEELAKDNYWAFPLWDKMVDVIATEYANETYNATTDRIRTRLLTSLYMPKLIRNWVSGKISDLNFANARARHYMNWAFHLNTWVNDHTPVEMHKDIPRIGEYESSYTQQNVIDACVAEFNALGVSFPDPKPEDTDA